MVHIVDDDESVRKSLSRLMRSMNINSQAYESAESFLAQDYKQTPGCILLDITMPKMNGVELAARLKADGVTMPIIAISARDDDEVRRLIGDLGVKFFLRKPVDDQALVDAISWVTRNKEAKGS